MTPARIQLSRRRGFDLQAASEAINGLPGYSVARPGKWGNPFTIADVAKELGIGRDAAQAEAVDRHRRWMLGELKTDQLPPDRARIRAELAGLNLACWCRAGTPCHADTLIRLANE
jgi:hypothetical protein